MRWFLLICIGFLASPAFAQELSVGGASCKEGDYEGEKGIVCLDENNFAFVFVAGRPTILVDLNTSSYYEVGAGRSSPSTGNFLERFGRALENGFEPRGRRDSSDNDKDPLCVTQLQKKQNSCHD